MMLVSPLDVVLYYCLESFVLMALFFSLILGLKMGSSWRLFDVEYCSFEFHTNAELTIL